MILSVQKAMHILRVLSDRKNRPVSLQEISRKTGYPKPTCVHILQTLCHDGYVIRQSHSEGYTLGPSLYHLTRYGPYEQELIALCRPVMRWMERKSGATVVLSVIRNKQKFIIAYADSEQNLLVEHPSIRTDDIYRTATGRAMLAWMEPREVQAIWEKYGAPPAGHWEAVTTLEELTEALRKLRKQQVIISKDGKNVGFACPLFRGEDCIGAIGLAWKGNAPEEKVPHILVRGTKELLRRLNYE